MGDRYYTQMMAHAKLSRTELNTALNDLDSKEGKKLINSLGAEKVNGKKLTRVELNNTLTELLGVDVGFAKLPYDTLATVLNQVKAGKVLKVGIPEGRLKAPYIKAMQEALQTTTLELDAVTVKAAKLFLGAIK